MDDVRDQLLRLELALASRHEADLPGGYAGVIDDGFRETGASGRRWTRDEVLGMLADAAPDEVAIERFVVEELAPGVILATYDTAGARPACRMSIWVRVGDRWRIRFHQGTPL